MKMEIVCLFPSISTLLLEDIDLETLPFQTQTIKQFPRTLRIIHKIENAQREHVFMQSQSERTDGSKLYVIK